MTVEFRDPPPSTSGRTSEKWQNIVNTLLDNPGKCAFVGNWSPGVATQIRLGNYPAFLFGDNITDADQKRLFMKQNFHVETRKSAPGRADVYVTYIGDYRK